MNFLLPINIENCSEVLRIPVEEEDRHRTRYEPVTQRLELGEVGGVADATKSGVRILEKVGELGPELSASDVDNSCSLILICSLPEKQFILVNWFEA